MCLTQYVKTEMFVPVVEHEIKNLDTNPGIVLEVTLTPKEYVPGD